ncbi:lytic transglycosylase domain-containing protein [uncultured Microbacterium sp.]|uniref:aggregation-promoting factor C-terminal-like domain-containing protein n=1 Tax=uncultured Microbacterium sp. TaxID=191216 RepID=UPI0025938407|nr:lytic transglycosylase domain-containing protein [uncultured Microbacterium sp.]
MTSDAELTPAADPTSSPPALRSTALRSTPARTAAPAPRWSRRRGVMSVFALFAVAAFGVAYIGPLSASTTQAEAAELDPLSLYAGTIADAQSYLARSDQSVSLGRDGMVYTVYVAPKPSPTPTAVEESSTASAAWTPPFVSPDPGTAQAVAYSMVQERGWGDEEFACLVALWSKESGWRVNAYNSGSGAYGIPQALPGNKMASAGADWETNPATQVAWGLGYISGRYGTPCGAWGHSQSSGWY